MGLYALSIFIDLITTRFVKRFIFEMVILLGFIAILNVTTEFPFPSTKQAFGGVSPIVSIIVMFFCIIFGMVARTYYEFKDGEGVVLRSFLKPFCVSPIVLLPLIGAVQGTSDLEYIQLTSFGILAFQNGFFWKVVFGRAKKML